MNLNERALDELKRCKDILDKVPVEIRNKMWLSNASPKKWFDYFNTNWETSDLSEKPLNRSELLEQFRPYRNKGKLDESIIRKLIISVLAWGGMGYSKTQGKLAISTIGSYERVCTELLNGMLPVDAYAEFFELKKLREMKGIGPAYYTKLIFFFGNQSGLIMDRWTARSTNLLLGSRLIKLEGKTKRVSDNNSEQTYSKYLEFISKLQNQLEIETPAKTEELIFSCPHKHQAVKNRLNYYHEACSSWRKYVAENT
jgi:hypothetical protein